MTLPPIHLRKKRLPKPPQASEGVLFRAIERKRANMMDFKAIDVEDLEPHQIKQLEIYHEHGERIPLKDIFVDPGNGVILFRNPETGGWLYTPPREGVS